MFALAAGIGMAGNGINMASNELSSIWGADSPGWKVVGDDTLPPQNRTYSYDVDYFAVRWITLENLFLLNSFFSARSKY